MSRAKTRLEQVKEWVKILRKDFPLDRRIYVRLKNLKDEHGLAWESASGKSYVMWLHPYETAITWEWFLHEWTHYRMHFFPDSEKAEHPPEYWVQFGRIRNFYHDEKRGTY